MAEPSTDEVFGNILITSVFQKRARIPYTMGKISKVIVVGAGPAGLVLALLLSKAGIAVQVLDAAEGLDNSPRATHYSSPALHELRRAGILDDVRKQGFIPNGVSWRKLDGDFLCGLKMDSVPFESKMVCLPLNRLLVIIKNHLDRQDNVDIKWSHKVLSIDQSSTEGSLIVSTPTGEETVRADYIIGCDGANSQVRKSLFGDWEFPGRTWDEQIVATNVYYDMSPYGWEDANFIVDTEHWAMVSKIGTDGLLRITYGEKPGLTREELRQRQPMKFKTFLPGHPEENAYQIVNFSPYRVHQRLSKELRVGRFLLAADAAHLCNPFGGLGLTGGLVDIGNLFDCLNGIHMGLAEESILDRYSQVRSDKYRQIIDPISSENMRRLWQDPAHALETDEFFQMCERAAADPEFSKNLQTGLEAIMHDFTREYKMVNGSV